MSSLFFKSLAILFISSSFLMVQTVKNLPAMQETWAWSLAQEEPLEKRMATHSSILTWKIPWTEEPGELQSMGHKELDTTEWLTLDSWWKLGSSLFFSLKVLSFCLFFSIFLTFSNDLFCCFVALYLFFCFQLYWFLLFDLGLLFSF